MGCLLSLPHDPALVERLQPYLCESDGSGLYVRVVDERLLVSFGMHLDYGAAYGAFGEDPFEGLSDLFETVRDELLAGDLSAAWATYQTYGDDEEEEPEPVEPLSPADVRCRTSWSTTSLASLSRGDSGNCPRR